MSTFSRLYKPYNFVGLCENQHFFQNILTFWPDFYYFMGIFGTQKMMCTLFLGGGGLRKCVICTLMKMLTFMDGPLGFIYLVLKRTVAHTITKQTFGWLFDKHWPVQPNRIIICS